MSVRGGATVLPFSEPKDSEHQVGKSTAGAEPPELPANYIYTRCYCEENVYLLCKDFMNREDVCKRWDIWVIFISNETKTVCPVEKRSRWIVFPCLFGGGGISRLNFIL
jgi:hypothetical protein